MSLAMPMRPKPASTMKSCGKVFRWRPCWNGLCANSQLRRTLLPPARQRRNYPAYISEHYIWETWGLSTAAKSTTMSVEPGVLDANVLACALNAGAPQHLSSRPPDSADSSARRGRMDGTPAAPTRHGRECVRPANHRHHAGQWNSPNLHVQYRRFRRLSRAFCVDAVACSVYPGPSRLMLEF